MPGLTVTKIRGPVATENGFEAIYRILPDNSFLVTGELIDLTADFSYITSASCCSVEAIADTLFHWMVVKPADTTAITSSNVLLSCAVEGTRTGNAMNARVLAAADAFDTSGVAELTIWVVGKKAEVTSWA